MFWNWAHYLILTESAILRGLADSLFRLPYGPRSCRRIEESHQPGNFPPYEPRERPADSSIAVLRKLKDRGSTVKAPPAKSSTQFSTVLYAVPDKPRHACLAPRASLNRRLVHLIPRVSIASTLVYKVHSCLRKPGKEGSLRGRGRQCFGFLDPRPESGRKKRLSWFGTCVASRWSVN